MKIEMSDADHRKVDADDPVANLPVFLRAKNLESFISNDLIRSSTPVIFETDRGGGMAGNKALGRCAARG